MAVDGAEKSIEFGRVMLKQHFPHVARHGVSMLNTGSFGLTPACLLKKKIQLMEDFESYGDNFTRQRLLGEYSNAVGAAAAVAGANPARCAIVDNVTFGTTAALQLLAKEVGDEAEILITTWTYGAVSIEADYLFPGRVRRFQAQLPIETVEQYVAAFAAELEANSNIRVAVVDYITSITACLLPVTRLIDECRKRNVKVVVDAAHAIGQVADLNVELLGADFFVGSLTKWMMTPKSAALLCVSEEFETRLKPLCISWFALDEDFRIRHAFIGTRDISSFLVVPDAIKFFENECGGMAKVHQYCTQLADEGSRYLVQLWQTEQLPVPSEMRAPYMRMIRLPDRLQTQEVKEAMKESHLFGRMWNHLLNREKIDILLLNINETVYIRVSFAIIVDMNDIRSLGDRILGWNPEDIE